MVRTRSPLEIGLPSTYSRNHHVALGVPFGSLSFRTLQSILVVRHEVRHVPYFLSRLALSPTPRGVISPERESGQWSTHLGSQFTPILKVHSHTQIAMERQLLQIVSVNFWEVRQSR